MSWDKELEELRHRERLAEQMGGEEKVARQHSRGKMDARARLAALVDPGSFREIGKIAGKASYDEDGNLEHILPAPFLFGKAEINGRPVVATADDFTIRGGAADAGISRKMVQAEKMAHELKLPIIRMIDGTGGGGSVKTLEQIGATYIPAVPGWSDVVKNLDTVPVVALALGPTAGLGATSRPRKISAAARSTPATAWSMTKWGAKPKHSPARGTSYHSCPNMSASLPAGQTVRTLFGGAIIRLIHLCLAIRSRFIPCAAASTWSSIRARFSRLVACGGAPASPLLPASTAGP